jgi:hypothetical protein
MKQSLFTLVRLCVFLGGRYTRNLPLTASRLGLKLWDVPNWMNCYPTTFGGGTFLDRPSNVSDSFACSPS